MKNYVNVFLLFVGLNGCIPKEGLNCHKSIGVRNNSSKDIWVYQGIGCYTTLSEYVAANSSRDKVVVQPVRGDCYEKYINGSFQKGKMDVFIFSIDPWTMKDNCDTTKLKSFLLETRVLTVDELQKSNWVITYPK